MGSSLAPSARTRVANIVFSWTLPGLPNHYSAVTSKQICLLPLRASSLEESVRLNGVQVDRNVAAFRWGRQYIVDQAKVESLVSPRKFAEAPRTLEDRIQLFADELVSFQNAAYADRYRRLVEDVLAAEQRVTPGSEMLTESVARYFHKLMAYKDEYEVARLLTLPGLDEQVAATFEAPVKQVYHLHPPVLRAMGMKQKLSLGPWIRPVLKGLAAIKFLRGTPLDVFGYAHLRREERSLVGWYEDMIRSLLPALTSANLEAAVEVAKLPDGIRGYEHIKLNSIKATREAASKLLARLSRPAAA